MAETNPDKALRYSAGKAGVDQIPADVLIEWGDVFTYGEKKYFRDNWKRGGDWHEAYGSALRHLYAFWLGEELDPESGLPHLAHALWNVGALRYYETRGLGNDDRASVAPAPLTLPVEECCGTSGFAFQPLQSLEETLA